MKSFIDENGEYYEGNKIKPSHRSVPNRPSPLYKYIEVEGEWKWVLDEDKDNEKWNKDIYKQLDALDLKSIRAIRDNDTEWIQKYKDQANELRNQLRKKV